MTGAALVVGVAGPPGSGKSTLSRALARRLGATLVEYDAYERVTSWPPDRLADWLCRGAPFGEIPVPGLAEDLARAKARGGFVCFDTLLGRAHGTGDGIDHLVWLDTDLDLALARKLGALLRDDDCDRRRFPDFLDGYLAQYPVLMRPLYLAQRERVRPSADQVLDGSLATAVQVEAVLATLDARMPA